MKTKDEFVLMCDDGNYTYCPTKESVTGAVRDFIYDPGSSLTETDTGELDTILFHLFADGSYVFEGDPAIRLFRLDQIPGIVVRYNEMENELGRRADSEGCPGCWDSKCQHTCGK